MKGRSSRNTTPMILARTAQRRVGLRGTAASGTPSCGAIEVGAWLVMVMSDTSASSQSEHSFRENVQYDQNRQQQIGIGELCRDIKREQVHHHTDKNPAQYGTGQAAKPADDRSSEGLQHEGRNAG